MHDKYEGQFTEMDEHILLAEQFEANRAHLRAVAYRMLGSMSEAEDAVQEAWLRLSRSDTGEVENLGGWLTRVVARVCLDMLRSRKSRREESLVDLPESTASSEGVVDPEHEAVMADSVGLALLVVLDTLNPAERLAFVLHDLFGVPFEEIGPIVGRSSIAARQLASRARRRVQGSRTPEGSLPSEADMDSRRKVVEAFLAASRGGDFQGLLSLLAPEAVLRADAAAVTIGAASEVRGAREVAGTFSGRARTAQPAIIDGAVGAVWAVGGQPRIVFEFAITDDKITEISMIADPDYLSEIDLQILKE
jgi:RNA polymerase sigma-70 factor (ECF subfamily)